MASSNKLTWQSHRRRAPVPSFIPEICAVGLVNCKQFGEAAEAAFLARASSLGFGVAKPWGDSEHYDFILDSGHRFWRVQVKSTEKSIGGRYRVRGFTRYVTYTPEHIDFLVVYIVPEDLWYVIPATACPGHKSLYFQPHGSGRGRFELYREGWCQMACARRSKRPSVIRVCPLCRKTGPGRKWSAYCPFRRSHL